MSLVSEAQRKLGGMFIIGFDGTKLSDDTSAFISQANIGGVIIYAQNYENPTQLAELSNEIQECRAELPLWVSVDQEGGKVQRLKEGFTLIPAARELVRRGSPRLIFEISEMMAKELKAVGCNLNFAPVVDINTRPDNPIIGALDRTFGDTAEEVCKMVTGFVRGQVVQKVQPCVKHFPGHGDTAEDSHTHLPKVETDLKTLHDREFRPFVKTFKSRCNMVMVAHIVNPNIDPEFPATLSYKTLTELLRKELRYSRIIISDDMEMKAITDHFGADEAAVMAVKAGCDMLIYRSEGGGRHAYEVLFKALEEGTIDPKGILESAEKVDALKKEILLPYAATNVAEAKNIVGNAEHKALVDKIHD